MNGNFLLQKNKKQLFENVYKRKTQASIRFFQKVENPGFDPGASSLLTTCSSD